MENHTNENLLNRGVKVFAALLVLSLLEFWVATSAGGSMIPLLALVAIVKTLLILEYYMHYRELFTEE